MKDRYDVIVVGAGPAGSIAATNAARKGLSVLLVEKRQEIGAPVRCAEGVSKLRLQQHIEPDESWICSEVRGAQIIAPNGITITMSEENAGSEVGYVLDRKVFDRALAEQTAEAGAEVLVKARVTGLIIEDDSVCGVNLMYHGEMHTIRSSIVIGADGVESKVGRWAGIDTSLKPSQIETCAQFLVSGTGIDQQFCYFYIGNEVAPAGYVWLFPKGNDLANVGIGILGNRAGSKRPIDLLTEFVEKNISEGRIIERVAGAVPASGPIEKTIANGLMLVGDAARQSDPFTGGGISNAMDAGMMAAEVATKAIAAGDVSEKLLQEYETCWRESIGKDIGNSLIVKDTFFNLPDEDLNCLAESVKDVDFDKMDFIVLVSALFKSNKKLLWNLRPLFTQKLKQKFSAKGIFRK
ncbi:NAD(P)/FAD-dependent oxidoreductase [Methanococcoides methylutens]|uniref:Digeranylgeranylglycerophospholipid reductase n=1 Tax=Methanococcoides methylutens MM1 TaxID=1434104 RepID=A0A0E3WZG3_METMT|nr:NAD(P)/FAD-dependent oxidoreductase [Methanococcoides methylutens]AKB85050.1 Digeranylgeranylglycerophospholipid reductase [Methanococcoides methylutens MM1]